MPRSVIHDEILRRVARFREEHFERLEETYRDLVEKGQNPQSLFIACSDSRILPHLLADADPGELFVLRNVGAIVPRYGSGQHSAGAAIEFAVLTLNVRHIVVCSHSHCGAMRALYQPPMPGAEHLNRWLDEAREAALDAPPSEEVFVKTEQRCVLIGIDRLLRYPFVAERVADGRLSLHGLYYIIERGEVLILDYARGQFSPL
jgi:carbonic anhydrase